MEEAYATMAQLLKSIVRLANNNDLIDKVSGAIVNLSVEHCLPTPAAEFLRLHEKLNVLRYTLLNSDKDLEFAWSKSEKSMLKIKMRVNLQKARLENIKAKGDQPTKGPTPRNR